MILIRPFILIISGILFVGNSSFASEQSRNDEPPKSFVQIARNLLGVPKKVAAAGSRSFNIPTVCIITPEINQINREMRSYLILPKPTIVMRETLNEIEIRVNNSIPWKRNASSLNAIDGTIYWPLKKLKGGDIVNIRVRPRGSSGGNSVNLSMLVKSQKELDKNSKTIRSLGKNITLWQKVLAEKSIEDPQIATALLFSRHAPKSPYINNLRSFILQEACSKKNK